MNHFSKATYIARRKVLKETLGSGRILFLGNDESSMNYKDNHFHYRQDSTFLYYFGIDLPGLMVIIDVDNDQETIFGNELTIDDIVWTGQLPTLQSLAEKVGVKRVKPTNSIIKHVGADILFLPPYRPEHTLKLAALTGKKPRKVVKGGSSKLIKAVCKQRITKSNDEVNEMNKAVIISDRMHQEVMRAVKPGMMEYELLAVAAKVAFNHNVPFSYPPILTKHGETLHNHYHGHKMKKGDMILFDGGTESLSHYAGDITRTFPVTGKFTNRQKDLYTIVYNAFDSAVAALVPGNTFLDIHLLACRKLTEGLVDMGIMKGNAEEAVAAGAHTMFFQCGLGHLIGMDVHDMENLGEENVGYSSKQKKSKAFGLKSLRLGRKMEKGYAVTIEPGIYIVPELIDLRKSENAYTDFINYSELEKFRDFGGIRLEDDFVVTKGGNKLLGIEMPLTATEVESFMAG